MLVLTGNKAGFAVEIGPEITVKLLRIRGKIRVGIVAPRDLKIRRVDARPGDIDLVAERRKSERRGKRCGKDALPDSTATTPQAGQPGPAVQP